MILDKKLLKKLLKKFIYNAYLLFCRYDDCL